MSSLEKLISLGSALLRTCASFFWQTDSNESFRSVAVVKRTLEDSVQHRFQRRRALIVGINYTTVAKNLRLRGCVNDAKNMYKFIHTMASEHLADVAILQSDSIKQAVDEHEFECEIRVLTDDPVELEGLVTYNPKIQTVVVDGTPTASKLRENLEWLVKGANKDTSLWFSYSGHGTYVRDYNGDESDLRDEALVPLDYETKGVITDDWLRANVVDALPSGCKLTCLVDACHSATSFDLHVSIEDFSTYQNSSKQRLSKVKEYNREDWRMIQRRTVHRKTPPCAADVLMISGCRDNQTSADAYENGDYTGAMTFAFLQFYPQCDDIAQLLQDMNVWLRLNKYQQRPILSFGSVAAERVTSWQMQLF